MTSFADPMGNVLQLGLKAGMKVGDFGAGSGHYALAAASLVGEGGKVYAIDVQEEVLIRLKAEAAQRGLRNLETIWGDFEKPGGTTLKDATLDAVILSNTLFQLDHKEGAIAEIKRVLKQGGWLLVIDWSGAFGGMGPMPHLVIPEREAEELFIGHGFHKVKSFPAGPQHYSIVFRLS